jgi:hypothetical protein
MGSFLIISNLKYLSDLFKHKKSCWDYHLLFLHFCSCFPIDNNKRRKKNTLVKEKKKKRKYS